MKCVAVLATLEFATLVRVHPPFRAADPRLGMSLRVPPHSPGSIHLTQAGSFCRANRPATTRGAWCVFDSEPAHVHLAVTRVPVSTGFRCNTPVTVRWWRHR